MARVQRESAGLADRWCKGEDKQVEDEFRVLSFMDWLEVNTTDLE